MQMKLKKSSLFLIPTPTQSGSRKYENNKLPKLDNKSVLILMTSLEQFKIN